ncbi:hypothetical protein LTS18_000140, partial [Coniosporium uncinatum]
MLGESHRKRRLSVSSDQAGPAKKVRQAPFSLPAFRGGRGDRGDRADSDGMSLLYNEADVRSFMAEVRDILRLEINVRARDTWGYQTNSRVLQLLERACPARSTGEPHEREVLVLDCVEAKHHIESSVPLTVPVVTQDQQMFEWEDGSRPIQQLCKRTGVLKRK